MKCSVAPASSCSSAAWIRHQIRIGQVVVQQGDLVVGDRDGVVVLPAAALAETLDAGSRRELVEADMIARIRAGERTIDTYAFGD